MTRKWRMVAATLALPMCLALPMAVALPVCVALPGAAFAGNSVLPEAYAWADDAVADDAVADDAVADGAVANGAVANDAVAPNIGVPADEAPYSSPEMLAIEPMTSGGAFSNADVLGDDALADLGAQSPDDESGRGASELRSGAFGEGNIGHSSATASFDNLAGGGASSRPVIPASAMSLLESLGLAEAVQ